MFWTFSLIILSDFNELLCFIISPRVSGFHRFRNEPFLTSVLIKFIPVEWAILDLILTSSLLRTSKTTNRPRLVSRTKMMLIYINLQRGNGCKRSYSIEWLNVSFILERSIALHWLHHGDIVAVFVRCLDHNQRYFPLIFGTWPRNLNFEWQESVLDKQRCRDALAWSWIIEKMPKWRAILDDFKLWRFS